jgi:hypothetical protein
MKKSPVADRMAKVESRYGKTTGASKGSAPAPKVKIKPTGNPLKGKAGIKATWKF